MTLRINQTIVNFLYLTIIVPSVFFTEDTIVNSNRIRHARSKSLYLNTEGFPLCPVRERFDRECPKPSTCRTNGDCFKEYGSEANVCVCDAHLCGMVCVRENLNCTALQNPAHGQVSYVRKNPNYPYFIVGTKAVYTCQKGYNIRGTTERFCLATSKWSGKAPQCTNQTDLCPDPPYIRNAEIVGDINQEYRNGDTVKFRCRRGFHDKYMPEIKATCINNQWNYDGLRCEAIECGEISELENGKVIYRDGTTYTASVFMVCNDDYTITCRPESSEMTDDQVSASQKRSCERKCQENGKWSGLAPICKPILCPHLLAPKNGNVTGFWTKVNSIVTFSCNPGYELVGSPIRTCKRSGQWDGELASCKVRDCGPPPVVAYSSLTYSSTSFGNKAVYKCDENTTPWGESNILTCGETGSLSLWLPRPPPQCLKHCQRLSINHAVVTVNDPNDGQILQKSTVSHALTLNVNCSSGYALDRNILPTCKNGTWSYIPSCKPAPCVKRPPILTNGISRFYSRQHGAIARYYCYSGYIMKSYDNSNSQPKPAIFRCKFGQWRGEKPRCVSSRCHLPPAPKEGRIYIIGKNGNLPVDTSTNRPRHNDVLEYECKKNFRLVGTKHAVCLSGKWSPSETPKCEKIMHDALPSDWVFYKNGPFEND